MEAVARKRQREPLEREAAKEREEAGRGRPKKGANFAPNSEKGKSRKKVAESVGMSHTTLAKAEAVVEAAEEDPEAVARKRQLEPMAREAAKERQETTRFGSDGGANLAPPEKGKSRDRLAQSVGYGRTTLAKAEAVVEAAEKDPEVFGSARFLCRIRTVM